MRALAPADLLDVWERGAAQPPTLRALLLLAAVSDEPPDALAALPVGRRDAQLLHLRALTFGPVMEGETACPACSERLELAVRTDDLLASAPAEPAPERLAVEVDGTAVAFRLPTTRDLADAEQPDDFFRRCLLDADPATLSHDATETIARAMADADPLAAVRWQLTCPACEHAWTDVFDIATYFCAEVERYALQLLGEVHRLALAYGWTEGDVLALSHRRRLHYLALLTG